MHVFLSEFLTCGALAASAERKPSLAVEGAAMLRALAEDAVAAGYEVSTTWDPACGEFGVKGVAVHIAETAADENRLFLQLMRTADTTLVIAPEFDCILAQRSHTISLWGDRSSGSSTSGISLCADKLLLSHHLEASGIPTIDTISCPPDVTARELSFPCVIKPRFGAGSLHAFLLAKEDEQDRALDEAAASGMEAIAQPFIAGQPLSVAAIVSQSGIEMFPLCTQTIRGKRLEYAGGTVPASVERADAVVDLARRAIEAVPGLRGYVGVDLILPDDDPPVIVEINPRLTSSYHGYRRLAASNLAPRVLEPDASRARVEWNHSPVTFAADSSSH